MSRVLRSLLGNVITHNIVQGINKECIFQSDKQKKEYIKLIKKYGQKYQIIVIAYCIMSNHAHLLIYSKSGQDISLFMKEVNANYAIYYNKTENREGYVFKSRFYSKIIYDQDYLLKCIKYIHMNPVKAGICLKEEDYNFSSYKNYLDKNQVINSKIFQLVFNQEEEYLKIFNSISYRSLNLENEKVNLQEVLEKFLNQEKRELFQIQKDSILIKKFISYLISNEYEFTKTDLADILKISRAKLYRKLN